MSITDDQAIKLFQDIKSVCIKIIKDAHNYIGTHKLESNPFIINEYPMPYNEIFYDDTKFSIEDRDKIPMLKYNIPFYTLNRFPIEKNYYDAIFNVYKSDGISINNYEEINEIMEWINTEPEVLRVFTDKDKLSDYTIRTLVLEIVLRYLYMTDATESVPDNLDDIIRPYITEKILFFLEDTLYFDVCVPICLATFECEFHLDENVEIKRISEEVLKSRLIDCKYEVAKEECVAACATHMIVFHNISYKKQKEYSFDSVVKDYSCYPLDQIDEIFGVFRIATGYDIGYENILCIPNEWVYDTSFDLLPVYGAKSHFVNKKYTKRNWMDLPVSYISKEKCDEIADLFKGYKANEQKLKFSLMRFNRCMLRDETDDMITDACIGIESLLSGGTHSEITYTISNRIPVILSKEHVLKYSVTNARKLMKLIYNLRSKIVHGSIIKDKDLYYEIEEEKLYIPKVAVDFLRITLLFMINNSSYIKPEEIDKYIDSIIVSS